VTSGIIYLLTGAAHAVRLAVSIWSLRKHYSGPVVVYSTQPESHQLCERMATDPRLGIEHRRLTEIASRKNSTFLTKVALTAHAPFEANLFLDADTLIVGDPAELLDFAPSTDFHATQFANWTTGTRIIRKRIERWRTIEQQCYPAAAYECLIADALKPAPAINVGVFAFRRGAPFLAEWSALATLGAETFICDEIAMQLLLNRCPHRIFDCRYNCSPTYAPRTNDTRIWHFHGEKHVSGPTCRTLWWPTFAACLQANVGGMVEWVPSGDKRLAKFLRFQEANGGSCPMT